MLNRLQQQLVEAGLAQPDQARKEPPRGGARKGKAARGAKKKSQRPSRPERATAGTRDNKPDPAVRAQVRDLVAKHRVEAGGEEVGFNFQVGTRIRRIHVSSEQHRALMAGELAVIALDGRHALMPVEKALAVRALEPRRVVYLNDSPTDGQGADDGDHPVPDDLMW